MGLFSPINNVRIDLLHRLKIWHGLRTRFQIEEFSFEIDHSKSLDRQLYKSRSFEPDLKAVRKLVLGLDMRNKSFADVGANAGHWTVALARLFEKTVAFEPNEAIRPRLIKNLNLNSLSNVEVSQLALADENGEVTFFIRESLDNSGALNDGLGTITQRKGYVRETKIVPAAKLDSISQGLDFGLIKIDVEGAENLVLTGAKQTLSRCRPIVVSEMLLGDDSNQTLSERFEHFPNQYLHFSYSEQCSKLTELTSEVNFKQDFNLISLPEEYYQKIIGIGLLDAKL